MYEFHVDTSKKLLQFINDENKQYSGNLPVRKNPNDKPLIRVGQDESLFHKNQLGRKSWILSDGRKRIDPKSDGDAIMGSAFNSRVFGFGMDNNVVD